MSSVVGDSKNAKVPAVQGTSDAGVGVSGVTTAKGSFGVYGECATGHGVHGQSTTSRGVVGESRDFHGVYGHSTKNAGVAGESDAFHAVYGSTKGGQSAGIYGRNVTAGNTGAGILGENPGGDGVVGLGRRGVVGRSEDFQGVYGHSNQNAGVVGESDGMHAVFGITHGPGSAGVYGNNSTGGPGQGVLGEHAGGDGVVGSGRRGVVGLSEDFQGVYGHSNQNAGVVGESRDFVGVYAVSHRPESAAVSGNNRGGLAGYFDGDLAVTGDVKLLGADCAEDFDVIEQAHEDKAGPGSVMVLHDSGGVRLSHRDYDSRVVGVVSGAGRFKPAVILDHQDGVADRLPLALMGKVYCLVDATDDAISVGDLLTTSSRPGHAMKAADPARAFGAVIGKALQPCRGRGLIPILVTLQ